MTRQTYHASRPMGQSPRHLHRELISSSSAGAPCHLDTNHAHATMQIRGRTGKKAWTGRYVPKDGACERVCDDSEQSVAKRTRIVAEQGIWIFEYDL